MTVRGSNLTFNQLREANIRRAEYYKLSQDWNLDQWSNALFGEYGELATWKKKLDLGVITYDQFRTEAAKELADQVTYIDLYAIKLGIDLGNTVVDKFNEVSDRFGMPVKLESN